LIKKTYAFKTLLVSDSYSAGSCQAVHGGAVVTVFLANPSSTGIPATKTEWRVVMSPALIDIFWSQKCLHPRAGGRQTSPAWRPRPYHHESTTKQYGSSATGRVHREFYFGRCFKHEGWSLARSNNIAQWAIRIRRDRDRAAGWCKKMELFNLSMRHVAPAILVLYQYTTKIPQTPLLIPVRVGIGIRLPVAHHIRVRLNQCLKTPLLPGGTIPVRQ